LTIPSPSPLELPSSPEEWVAFYLIEKQIFFIYLNFSQIPQEDEFMVKHGTAPRLLIEESSGINICELNFIIYILCIFLTGSATSLTRAATTKDDEGSYRSRSITYDLPIDNLSKEDPKNKLNPSNDQLKNEHRRSECFPEE